METTEKTEPPEKPGRRRGPVPGPERLRTTVYLDPDLIEWGKHQPGGLSEFVRLLLQEARARQERTEEKR